MLHPLTLPSVSPPHLLPSPLVLILMSCVGVSLQKVLSELQAENQQRLKEREQELKDMKKVMEQMKVGQHHLKDKK